MPRGRERILDEGKLREVCALLSAGCSLQAAAHYVQCAPNTIRREAARNPDFGRRFREARLQAQLSPLQAMRTAAASHWRAAAWMLERGDPDHFARRPSPILLTLADNSARPFVRRGAREFHDSRSEVHAAADNSRANCRLRLRLPGRGVCATSMPVTGCAASPKQHRQTKRKKPRTPGPIVPIVRATAGQITEVRCKLRVESRELRAMATHQSPIPDRPRPLLGGTPPRPQLLPLPLTPDP